MAQNSTYNLSMIFEHRSDWNFNQVTLTGRMIRTLYLVDGEKSVAELCEVLDETYDQLFSDLQELHERHLIKLAPTAAPKENKKPVQVKKGYFRGAGFEVTVSGNGKKIPTAPKSARVKKGYYRGAGFDVTVDENSRVVPNRNMQ